MKSITINCDVDGTVFTHDYPNIGHDIGAVPVLKALTNNGHKLIIFTMRDGKELQEAVDWFAKNEIPVYGVQSNPTQKRWTKSPKSYAQLMIDDSSIFAPLIFDETISNRPFINWVKVEEELKRLKLI
jgi:hypothetical protein